MREEKLDGVGETAEELTGRVALCFLRLFVASSALTSYVYPPLLSCTSTFFPSSLTLFFSALSDCRPTETPNSLECSNLRSRETPKYPSSVLSTLQLRRE